MIRIVLKGKEIELRNNELEIKEYLESIGGRRISPQLEGKTVKELLVDPLTIGIIGVGVGGYIIYRLTKEQFQRVEKAIG